jgi:hypothetical protein
LFTQLEATKQPDLVVLPAHLYAFLGALEACHRIGAVSAGEEREWREKAQREMTRLTESREAKTLAELVHLRTEVPWDDRQRKELALELLDDVCRQLDLSGQHAEITAWQGFGALDALRRVGLLSEAEATNYRDRIYRAAFGDDSGT